MTHEERIELENKMMELLKEFWKTTIERVQQEGLSGTGKIIDEKKRDEILDIYYTINVNSVNLPIEENFIYQSMTSFEKNIQKIRSEYNDIDENTKKLEGSIKDFFKKVYSSVNQNIKDINMVRNNKTDISQQEVNKIMQEIDSLGKDVKTKAALKKSINEVVAQLSSDISPIQKRVNIEDIQTKIDNTYFGKGEKLKKQMDDVITKREKIFNAMYNGYKKRQKKSQMRINREQKEDSQRKMDKLGNDYNSNEREIGELTEERTKLNKYLNQMRFYAQQDSKETSYRKIKKQQKEYTEEFLKELQRDAYNLSEWQVKEISEMVDKIRKTVNVAKNGLENDNILEQLEAVVGDYFAVKISNLEIKNLEVLEKSKVFTNDNNVNQEFNMWLSNELAKNKIENFGNLQVSYKYVMPEIEHKIKLLQLIKINNVNLAVDNTTQKGTRPVIGISELKDKNDEQISRMLENKLEKSIEALGQRKYKVIKGNTKIKPKLTEKVRKIFNVGKTKNVLKRMLKEFTVTEELGKQNEQVIKRIQTQRSILSTTKIEKEDILNKIDKAKEINADSKRYEKDVTEGTSIEKGIVNKRKKALEGQLNKMLSDTLKKRNNGKEISRS